MNGQLSLYDPVRHVRRTDPATSHDAATRAVGNSELRRLILETHRLYRDGLTDNELRARLDPRHNHGSVSKRRKDLVDAGQLAATDVRRGGQIVWRIT